MNKTVEQMAEEYANNAGELEDTYVWRAERDGFLAGYQAAKDDVQTQLAVGEDVVRELLNAPKWISVKDRLPEHFEDVLTFEDGECYRVNSISQLTKYWWDSDEGFERHPSHWMPLPKPPESK